MKPFGSPTLSDQALMRFPSLKLGPGESSRSHTADEFILVSEIKQAIDCYLQLLDVTVATDATALVYEPESVVNVGFIKNDSYEKGPDSRKCSCT